MQPKSSYSSRVIPLLSYTGGRSSRKDRYTRRRESSAVPGSFMSLTFSCSSSSSPRCLIRSPLSITRCTTMRCGSATFSTSRMWRSSRRSSSSFNRPFSISCRFTFCFLVIFPVILLGLRWRPRSCLSRRSCSISSCRSPTCRCRLIRKVTSGISILSPGSFCLSPELRSVFLAAGSGGGRVGARAVLAGRRDHRCGGVCRSSSAGRSTVFGTPSPVSCSRSCGRSTRTICRRSGSSRSSPRSRSLPPSCPADAAILRSAAAKPLVLVRSTIAGGVLPRHSAVGARAFRALGIQFGNRHAARSLILRAFSQCALLRE